MTPVFDSLSGILICHKNIANYYLQQKGISLHTYLCESVLALDVDLNILSFITIKHPTGVKFTKLLDRYLIILPEESNELHSLLLNSFFSFIANDYDIIIEKERNIDNIKFLIKKLFTYIDFSINPIIVDFGCGTGLSSSIKVENPMRLVGVDSCPVMRHISSKKGLSSVSPDILREKFLNCIDGAFASYVLHLLPNKLHIEQLWDSLKIGGILVANHHKGIGVDYTHDLIYNLGGSVCEIHPPNLTNIHGKYFSYKKEV